jgi:hypothetical protein
MIVTRVEGLPETKGLPTFCLWQLHFLIEKMLQTVASSISKRAKVPLGNIFINHRFAHSGSEKIISIGK